MNAKEIIARHSKTMSTIEDWLFELGFSDMLSVVKPASGETTLLHDHTFTLWRKGSKSLIVHEHKPRPATEQPRPFSNIYVAMEDGNDMERLHVMLDQFSKL